LIKLLALFYSSNLGLIKLDPIFFVVVDYLYMYYLVPIASI